MTRRGKRDSPQSILARLRSYPRRPGVEAQRTIEHYVHERLLYRLAMSLHRDAFVLKGAMLLSVLLPGPARPTRDLDLLGSGAASPDRLRLMFEEIAALDGAGDGVEFDASSVTAAAIREDAVYGGVRVNLIARIGSARIPAQIDVGFGDVVSPAVREIEFPSLLELPRPRVRAYPAEAVIAEKLHALVVLGIPSSRLRDYHDLRALATALPFDGPVLSEAIRATFERRRTDVPAATPIGLTAEFSQDAAKNAMWAAFQRKIGEPAGPRLDTVVSEVAGFALPPLAAIGQNAAFDAAWPPCGPWQART